MLLFLKTIVEERSVRMKNYCFNYDFLARWQKANKGVISRDDILRGLGTKNKGSLAKWKRGEVPMPIESLLRLCNTFDIDLSNFFFEGGECAELCLSPPEEDAKTEPTGYGRKDAPDFHRESMMPYEPPEEESCMASEPEPDDERRHYDRLRKEFERMLQEIQQEHRDSVALLSRSIVELKDAVERLVEKGKV